MRPRAFYQKHAADRLDGSVRSFHAFLLHDNCTPTFADLTTYEDTPVICLIPFCVS